MSELAPVAFVLVFALVVGGAVWLLIRTTRRNRAARNPATSQALSHLATTRGWQYTPQDDAFLSRFTGYPFGRGGRTQPAFDLVTGTHRTRSFAYFQYAPPRSLPPGEYSAEIAHLRVTAVSLPDPVPTLLISPAGPTPLWTRHHTTGDTEFDHTFTIGTDDTQFADRVLGPPVRRWLLNNPPPGPLRFGGPDLITWHPDDPAFKASEVEPALDHLCDLLDQLPPDALRQTP